VWAYSHTKFPRWANVPPPPSVTGMTFSFLGDKIMAYRSGAIALQSFGNSSGQVQALKDYNYDHLAGWFALEDQMDSKSNYVPFLAAYYFGATQNTEQLHPVIEYLRRVGKNPEGEKWRYLGQAVYLARHRLNDMPLALDLAKELAATYRPGMPAWPLQMQAIISSDMGDKDTAYALSLEILRSSAETMDPVEVNFMVDYICDTILPPAEASINSLCTDRKKR
jgi:hypothetical protein